MVDRTTIPISKATRDRLRGFGRKGESWDALLRRIMDELERERGKIVTFEPVIE